jgi:hypothetical protein
MTQPKVAMSVVADLQRELEEAPHCDPTEVSKAEALRLLLPQIQVMQSKGYSLAHIAAVLSNRGIAVTDHGLKNHLYRLRSSQNAQTSKKRPQASPATRTSAAPVDRPQPATTVPPKVSAAPAVRSQPPERPAPSRHSPVPVTSPGTDPKHLPASSGPESPPHRFGFAIRPDTKDL